MVMKVDFLMFINNGDDVEEVKELGGGEIRREEVVGGKNGR